MNGHLTWAPPWERIEDAGGTLLVWNDTLGLHVQFTVLDITAPSALWVARWLKSYLASAEPTRLASTDHTFFYVLFGSIKEQPADDCGVDGSAVLEAGTGCAPAGNPDGVEIRLSTLVSAAMKVLYE